MDFSLEALPNLYKEIVHIKSSFSKLRYYWRWPQVRCWKNILPLYLESDVVVINSVRISPRSKLQTCGVLNYGLYKGLELNISCYEEKFCFLSFLLVSDNYDTFCSK